jgi:hypothetical protein
VRPVITSQPTPTHGAIRAAPPDVTITVADADRHVDTWDGAEPKHDHPEK